MQVGERLARVMAGGEHVEDRHRGVRGELLEQRVGAGADADRRHVAREDARGVADRLAARRAAARRGAARSGWPPSSKTPASNDSRVRVEGFSKISATAPALERARRAAARPSARAARSSSACSSSRSSSVAGEQVARQAGSLRAAMRVLTWNLFHGRAVPAAGRDLLRRVRGRARRLGLGRRAAAGGPAVVAARARRARATRSARTALTSRNALLPLRRPLAERWPDVIKSNGGGANAILVRGAAIAEHRRRVLRRWPERRVCTRCGSPTARGARTSTRRCTRRGARAGRHRAARRAAVLGWAGGGARRCSAATSTSASPPSPRLRARSAGTASTTSSAAALAPPGSRELPDARRPLRPRGGDRRAGAAQSRPGRRPLHARCALPRRTSTCRACRILACSPARAPRGGRLRRTTRTSDLDAAAGRGCSRRTTAHRAAAASGDVVRSA